VVGIERAILLGLGVVLPLGIVQYQRIMTPLSIPCHITGEVLLVAC
jgi:hypothetical protein